MNRGETCSVLLRSLPFGKTGVNNALISYRTSLECFPAREFLRWPETPEEDGRGGRGRGGEGEGRKEEILRGDPSFLLPCSFFSPIHFSLSRCDFWRWFVSQSDARPDENLEMGISKGIAGQKFGIARVRISRNVLFFFFFLKS